MADNVAVRYRGGDNARTFSFNPRHLGLANSGFGLHLLQEPNAEFPSRVGLAQAITQRTCIHSMSPWRRMSVWSRGSFQPQDSDLLPLLEQDVLDETVAENPETREEKGLPAVGARR